MILIADSGSTKTDWCGLMEGRALRVQTQGINPFHQKQDDILSILYKELLPQLPVEPIEAVYFYGAGCTPTQGRILQTCLLKVFGELTKYEVNSDLLGAARALCDHKPGIACILGTGSNSCYYDGELIVNHVPSLGYILGDEGSGAYLGKRLLGDILKEQLPKHICIAFSNETQLTYEEIIHHVYRRPVANRYLASFAPFLAKYREEPTIHRLLIESFTAFIRRNLSTYPGGMPVNAIGSIAYYFKYEFIEALHLQGYEAALIEQSPMTGLIRYHQHQKD